MSRVVGIIRRPRATFQAGVASPRWGLLMAALFLINTGVNAAFLATPVGQQALVDQWERTALAFGQEVDDARYAEFQQLSRQGVAYAAAVQLLRGPVAGLALAALLYTAFATFARQRVAFRQVIAVVVYSAVILTLREVVAAPVNYLRESISSPTTLAQFFAVSNPASPVARFFGLIDVFVVWWLGVLAIGLGVLYTRRPWPIALALAGVYAAVALVLAGAMAVFGGTR